MLLRLDSGFETEDCEAFETVFELDGIALDWFELLYSLTADSW